MLGNAIVNIAFTIKENLGIIVKYNKQNEKTG